MTLFEIIFIVFSVSIIEEVVLVLPSTATAIASGILISNLDLNVANFVFFFIYIVIPLSLGMAIGSTVWFLIVKYGISLLEKRFKYFDKAIQQARVLIKDNPNNISWFYFSLRATPVFSGFVATFIGGLLNFPVLKHLIITFLGTTIRGGILAFIGWQVGEIFIKYFKFHNSFGAIFTVLILFTIFLYVSKKEKS